MNNFELIINSKPYAGWKNISVDLSLNRMTNLFQVSTTEELLEDSMSWYIRNGDSCEIKIDDQLILTGFIDGISHSYNAKDHSIVLKGRDKTCDLVDCSYYPRKLTDEYINQWKDQTPHEIINAICLPFDIEVVIDSSVTTPVTEPISIFKINDGETASESITRVCRSKGILAISKGDGRLHLTRAGDEYCKDSLTLGQNILEGNLRQSNRERFTHYVIKGKGKSEAKYLLAIEINPSAIIEDEVIMKKVGMVADRSESKFRFRPRVLLTEVVSSFTVNPELKKIKEEGTLVQKTYAAIDICSQRGEQEARVRAGKSRLLEYMVQGWTQIANGKVWELNKLVTVNDSLLNVKDAFLITGIKFQYSKKRGTIAILSLAHREAYTVVKKPIKEIKTEFDTLFTAEEHARYFGEWM